MSIGFIIAILALSIPVVAILSNAYVKIKKIEFEQNTQSFNKEQLDQLMNQFEDLQQENELLKERLSNIETIVAEPDWEQLLLHGTEAEKREKSGRLKQLTAKFRNK